jgi:hypothetical protein
MSERQLLKALFNLPSGYKRLQAQARKRNKYYAISPAFYEEVKKLGCFYCKTSLDSNKGSGIDRVDSKGHYTVDNVVGCCGTCNLAKRAMSVEEFLEWVSKVNANASRILEEVKTIKYNRDAGI